MITIQQTKSKRITPQLLKYLGAKLIDPEHKIWQVGLLQYAEKHPGQYQLWDEVTCYFFTDAIAVTHLHQLLIQYYGLTFKNLTK